MEAKYHEAYDCWRVCDYTGRPTLDVSEIMFTSREACEAFIEAV